LGCLSSPRLFTETADKVRTEGDKSYPTLELDEKQGTISVAYEDVVVKVDITQIKNLRLQYKSSALESVLVTTSAGQDMRFEGYEKLDVLAESLIRLTPGRPNIKRKVLPPVNLYARGNRAPGRRYLPK